MATSLNERLFFEEGEYPITVTPIWDKDMIVCPEHLRVKNSGDEPYQITAKLFGLRTSMTTKDVIDAMRELGVMPLFHFELAELLLRYRYLAKGRDVAALGNHIRQNRYPYMTTIMEGRLRRNVIEYSSCYCPMPNAKDWYHVKLWDTKSHLRFAVTRINSSNQVGA
ncbi:MAG: hypothetical protein U0487_00295 [Patescibacteria group bacterium]